MLKSNLARRKRPASSPLGLQDKTQTRRLQISSHKRVVRRDFMPNFATVPDVKSRKLRRNFIAPLSVVNREIAPSNLRLSLTTKSAIAKMGIVGQIQITPKVNLNLSASKISTPSYDLFKVSFARGNALKFDARPSVATGIC